MLHMPTLCAALGVIVIGSAMLLSMHPRRSCASASEAHPCRYVAAHIDEPLLLQFHGCACAAPDLAAPDKAEGGGPQGCEALIPGMKALIDRSAEAGVESICIGMPHRGARLHAAMHYGSHAAQQCSDWILASMPL